MSGEAERQNRLKVGDRVGLLGLRNANGVIHAECDPPCDYIVSVRWDSGKFTLERRSRLWKKD